MKFLGEHQARQVFSKVQGLLRLVAGGILTLLIALDEYDWIDPVAVKGSRTECHPHRHLLRVRSLA